MKKNFFISVIITSYNSEKYIKKTLESVLSQSYKNFEVIIVDDCSNDSTYQILQIYKKKDKRFKIYKLTKNSKTAAVPRNYALKKAKGQYISFLDSDDVWHKDKLQYQVSKLDKRIDIIHSACQYVDLKDKIISNFFINYLRIFFQYIFNYLISKNKDWFYLYNPINFSTSLVKRKLFNNYQFNIDKNIAGIEDLNLWLKIVYKSTNIKFLPSIKTNIRRKPISLHSNYSKQTVKSINCFSSYYISENKFINVNIFLVGITYKIFRPLIKKNLYFIFKNFYKIICSLLFTFI